MKMDCPKAGKYSCCQMCRHLLEHENEFGCRELIEPCMTMCIISPQMEVSNTLNAFTETVNRRIE